MPWIALARRMRPIHSVFSTLDLVALGKTFEDWAGEKQSSVKKGRGCVSCKEIGDLWAGDKREKAVRFPLGNLLTPFIVRSCVSMYVTPKIALRSD